MDDPTRDESTTGCRCHPVRPSTPENDSLLTTFPSTDFENKFVCGEIMSYEDLKEHGSETAVKAAGKLRQQGKPYESGYLSCLGYT